MRILVVGGGGREHALTWACRRDAADAELICAPGNAGTATIAENIAVSPVDPAGISRLATERDVDLAVIGPDNALAAGVADACRRQGIAVFGPDAAAARIESSKSYAKQVMEDAGIPTARWRSGAREQRPELLSFIEELGGRCVVKADGLALGKGVTVCDDLAGAQQALRECFDLDRHGVAGERVVVEELLSGTEVSVLALCDGERLRLLPASCDHKRLADGDVGPNTGGMGAHSPPMDVDERELLELVERAALRPCVSLLREQGSAFVGCLYAGVMLTGDGLRVLEFNARFGDPEAQVVLPRCAENVVELMWAAATGALRPGRVTTSPVATVAVVAAAAGYPGSAQVGAVVQGIDSVDPDVLVFHAGTSRPGGELIASGGRVLSVVARGQDVADARARAYLNLGRIRFEGMQHRRDIAAPAMVAL